MQTASFTPHKQIDRAGYIFFIHMMDHFGRKLPVYKIVATYKQLPQIPYDFVTQLTIRELVESAKKLRYKYIAICDHSASLKVAGGLSKESRLKQIAEIKKLNKKMTNFRILAGAEIDIRTDGTLDCEEEVLRKLDIVVAAIHTGFKQDIETMTFRITEAMRNKFVNVIAHPTGRLIQTRDAYQVDMQKVFEEAKRTNTFLELNSFPDRLDLNDINCREAKAHGIKIALGTDCHNRMQMEVMKYGVGVARRGWLEKKDVINCLKLEDLMKLLYEKGRNK